MTSIQQNNSIPEVNVATRLVMANWDLLEAQNYMLILGNEAAEIEALESPESVKKSLLTSAIVAYCRPFGNNKGAGIATKRIDISDYSDIDLSLHETLIELRDKAIAHADADTLAAQFIDHGHQNMMMVTEPTFDINEKIRPTDLAKQIDSLLRQIQEKMHKYSDKLRAIPGALGLKFRITLHEKSDKD
jgi:hypothetical protein